MSAEDPTEAVRMAMTAEINKVAAERAPLEAAYGQVWDTKELQQDFDVTGFAAPFCVVRRKSDGAEGSIMFQHWPRYYFSFRPGKV